MLFLAFTYLNSCGYPPSGCGRKRLWRIDSQRLWVRRHSMPTGGPKTSSLPRPASRRAIHDTAANEQRTHRKRHADRDLHRPVRGQGPCRTEQGAVSDGFAVGDIYLGKVRKNHAGTQCGIRQYRTRKGRLHPLPRPGDAFPLAPEACRLAAARQTGTAKLEARSRRSATTRRWAADHGRP